jgi:superfamily II DNA or RNA helicase
MRPLAPPQRRRPLPTPPAFLRPRQKAAYNAVFQNLARGIDSQLVALPTGMGKTKTGLAIAHDFERVLFLVHRGELLEQTVRAYGETPGARSTALISARSRAKPEAAHVTVGMIQTLRGRLEQFDRNAFDLLIVDEAHHAAAKEWRITIEHFLPELRLGLSATPERLDGAPLSNLFSMLAYTCGIREAVQEGALVTPIAMEVQTGVDLSGVKRTAGDFNAGQLQSALNTPPRNRLILRTFVAHARERKAIAFTAGVQHARDLAKLFGDAGISACAIAGDDKDRREKLDGLRTGRYQVAFNAMLLTEGYDDPTVDAVLMCRPTQSAGLYTQAVGRGLRLNGPDKRDCLIIDYHDASRTHRLASVWDFWGARAKKRLNGPTDLREATERFEADLQAASEHYRINEYLQRVDVLEPPPDIDPFVLGAYAWHTKPATEKQLATLTELGYDTGSEIDWTRGQASAVIGKERASDSQLSLLLALGYDTVAYGWTRDEATRAIDAAKSKGKEPDWTIVRAIKKYRPREAPTAPT